MIGPASTFSRRLLEWYDRSKRNLPWRILSPSGRPDPYHVLVSEAMLQQTQVATVIPYFHRFLERFPTMQHLAAADEQDVLRLWQGLGYYSRARNLLNAARAIVENHGGVVPSSVEALLELPGVGRYTAGAVASIAHGTRAPILDGNVMRVLCRIDAIESDPREKETLARLWDRATAILPKARVGDFNSALMELGATVCVPRSPACLTCPVRPHCEAAERGIQNRIPPVRQAKQTPLLLRSVYCIRSDAADGTAHWLIEQRPETGRWAGMWQFVTVERNEISDHQAELALLPVKVKNCRRIGDVGHALTHRRYLFHVFVCEGERTKHANEPKPRRWVKLSELERFPLPRPHVKVAGMLASV